MRRNFGSKPYLYPMPVLIIGTYDKQGSVDPDKLCAISFDPVNNVYLKVCQKVGNAFSDGRKLK